MIQSHCKKHFLINSTITKISIKTTSIFSHTICNHNENFAAKDTADVNLDTFGCQRKIPITLALRYITQVQLTVTYYLLLSGTFIIYTYLSLHWSPEILNISAHKVRSRHLKNICLDYTRSYQIVSHYLQYFFSGTSLQSYFDIRIFNKLIACKN